MGERFGADPADVDSVRAVFEAAGVTVSDVHTGSRRMSCTGPSSAVSALFATELRRMRSTDPRTGQPVEHSSRSGELGVPSALDGIVVGVFGLDSRPQARGNVRRPTRSHPRAVYRFDVPVLAQVYDFPADTNGSGQVAAIMEFDGGFSQKELDTYFDGLGIPRRTVTSVGVNGVRNVANQGFASDNELLLDVEVLGALAPRADLVVYQAPNDDRGFVDGVATAVHATPTPTVLSISFGQSEDTWTAQARTVIDDLFQDAAALGVTVCAASGDNGSVDTQTDGHPHVDFPAASPHVLACGGTTVLLAPSGAPQTETVWNEKATGGGATGGGVSTKFPLPDWQSHVGVPARAGSTGAGRGVPDVAALADPMTGYRVMVDGPVGFAGGTSTVDTLWAALVCRLAQALGRPLGLLQPALYALAAEGTATEGFPDVAHGNNGAYSARVGWDPCTGLGVPVGSAFLALLREQSDEVHHREPRQSGPSVSHR